MLLMDFSKIKFDIIIQAGQSNSEGYGFGNVENAYEFDGRTWYLSGDWRIPSEFYFEPARECVISAYSNTIRSNSSLEFARRYVSDGLLEEGRNLLIIRSAVGGSGFLDNYWKPEDRLFVRMIAMAKSVLELNPENRLKLILWHQGETDAIFKASYETHYNHFKTFITTVRDTFDLPELPIIVGDFVPQWAEQNKEIVEPVVKAMRDVCKDVGNSAFVESTGLLSNAQDDENNPNEDIIHFCRRSLYEYGDRYYDAYVEMMS